MPKITRLEIKNCLGIKELELQAGKVNLITGGNEKGKTSVLEVIEKGVQNSKRRTQFVKEGAKEATLYIEMDDTTTINRKVSPDGKESAKITQHGASIPKPESYLKSLVGEGFGFNPIDFMGKKDKEQTEILLSLMPMRVSEAQLQEWFGEVPPVNLNQHAIDVLAYLAEKYFYDKRAIANGEVKECNSEVRALFEQLPDNYSGDQWREVNIGDLWAAVQEGQKVNNFREQAQLLVDGLSEKINTIDTRYNLQVKEQAELLEFKIGKAHKSVESDKQVIRDEIESIQLKKISIEERIERLREEIKQAQDEIAKWDNTIALKENDLKNIDENTVATKIESLNNEHAIELKNIEEKRQAEIEEAKKKVANAQAYLDSKPAVEIEPLETKAQNAEKMKGFIALYDNMRKLQDSLKAKQEEATRLNDCVELARKKPAELLKEIEMPIKGLGINDQMQITIDGLPITNLSTSRQIKLALDIARATAGPLHLICIDRWESLDKTSQAAYFKEMEADDFQYFITIVTEGELNVTEKAVS